MSLPSRKAETPTVPITKVSMTTSMRVHMDLVGPFATFITLSAARVGFFHLFFKGGI